MAQPGGGRACAARVTPGDLDGMLSSLAPRLILDLACGRGSSTAGLALQFPCARLVAGLDLSRTAVGRPDTGLPPGVPLLVADAFHPPFGSCFDLVAVVASLHHVQKPVELLAVASSLLSRRGRLLVVEPYRNRQDALRTTHVLLHHWWAAVDSLSGRFHSRTMLRSGIEAAAREAGLAVDAAADYGELPVEPAPPEAVDQVRAASRDYLTRIPPGREGAALRRRGRVLIERLDKVGFSHSGSLALLCSQREPGNLQGS